jgi:hypothetical protein
MSGKHLAFALTATALVFTAALAQQPPDTQPAAAQLFPGLGQLPNLLEKNALLSFAEVQAELKITDSQKQQHEARRQKMMEKFRQTIQDLRKSKKSLQSKEAAEARDAIRNEAETALEQGLTPFQRDRLNQVQLQVQNAMAFERPDIQKSLDLSKDQAARIKKLADEGSQEILKASTIPVALKPKAGSSTVALDEVRAYVQTPDFTDSVRASRQRIGAARAAMMARVAAVLSDRQNAAYQKMLGTPFEIPMLGKAEDVDVLTRRVSVALGILGGGQRADPNFDVKVAKPAYTDRHPRVFIDEAHHNFHTAGGRYQPFAQLAANDGYKVVPNGAKFTREALSACDILVIANALGAASMADPGAEKPAFTDIECEVLRQWVEGGGSLLLITDHAPMGSAAECLAKKFGVNMSKGVATDDANCAEDRPASLMFTTANKLLADHPITRGRNDSERISRVRTFTGQSLKGPPGSLPIMKLGDTAVDHVDGNEISAAGRSQGIAFAFGKGRVVVLGEAAMLSAQVAGDGTFKMGMNAGDIDNKQFALNILHWLSGLLEPREVERKKAA